MTNAQAKEVLRAPLPFVVILSEEKNLSVAVLGTCKTKERFFASLRITEF
jgi:hypothetical protein